MNGVVPIILTRASNISCGARGDPGRQVLDLAAGTGKLTRCLTSLWATMIAVEPVPGMRTKFHDLLPEVEIIEGGPKLSLFPMLR